MSSVPFSAFRTSVLIINALLAIEELPGETSISRIGANTLSAVEVRSRWTGEINTSLTVPSLVDWATWVTTELLGSKEDKTRWTDAFVD